jgi:hypothetical protein
MKEKNVGWVSLKFNPTKPRIFRVGFRPSTQPTPKFIKALKIKGSEFLFNESNRRALR